MPQQEIPVTADGVPYLECPNPVAVWSTGHQELITQWVIDIESGQWGFNDTLPFFDEALIFSCPENVQ